MSNTYDWKGRHDRAMLEPNADEKPLVELLNAIDSLAIRFGDDYILREGVADIIKGAATLLNWDFGRLDRGTVSNHLFAAAKLIDFDLELEKFNE